MYELRRSVWIPAYLVLWTALVLSFALDWDAWLALVLASAAFAFTIFVDPAPRTYRKDPRAMAFDCDCPRCPDRKPVDPDRPDDAI